MTDDRRNPYVTLGIPFAASSDDAENAFARQARGLRRQPNGAEKLRELTWALNQVTEILRHPELTLHVFRIPSDAEAFEPSGHGVLNSGPERMARVRSNSDEAWSGVLEEVRREAVDGLAAAIADAAQLPER